MASTGKTPDRLQVTASLEERIAAELSAAAAFHEQNGQPAVAEALRDQAREHRQNALKARWHVDAQTDLIAADIPDES